MARTSATSASSLPEAQRSRFNSQAPEVPVGNGTVSVPGTHCGGRRVEVETAKLQATQEFELGQRRRSAHSYWVLPEVYIQLLISGKPTYRPDLKVYAKSGGVDPRVRSSI